MKPRHLTLAWAQRSAFVPLAPSQGQVPPEDALRVTDVRHVARQDSVLSQPWSSPRAPAFPPQRATAQPHGASALDPPELPTEDRQLLDTTQLLNAAVALDVLATRLRRIDANAKVLAEMVQACVALGELGGSGEDARKQLVHLAASATGVDRAALSQTLARRLAVQPRGSLSGEVDSTPDAHAASPQARGPARGASPAASGLPAESGGAAESQQLRGEAGETPPGATSVEAVVLAKERITDMAATAVREARLMLEAGAEVDYRQV